MVGVVALFSGLFFAVPGQWAAVVSARPSSRIILTLTYPNQSPVLVPRLPGQMVIQVPRFPHSTLTSARFPDGRINPLPGTPYVRTAQSGTFQVHASNQTVMTWFKAQFAQDGDRSMTSGTVGNYNTGTTESMLGFSPNPSSSLNITMTFYAPTPATTLYAIWATDVATPPRPLSTEIPLELRSLTGHIVMNGRDQQVSSHNRADLTQLARKINALKNLDPGGGCPLVTDMASLRLIPMQGPAISVQIASNCSVAVDGIAFQDYPAHPLWSALIHAVQH